MIQIKRVYSEPKKQEGFRILVDRLWPRGLSKEKANIDLWLKEVAPSDELRKWFSHNPDKWQDFKEKYKDELKEKEDLIKKINQIKEKENSISFLYSSKDKEHNNARALKEYLKK